MPETAEGQLSPEIVLAEMTKNVLRVFHAHRGDAIVVPVQAGVRLAGLLGGAGSDRVLDRQRTGV